MHQRHDHSFRKIFAHKEMIESLLRGFVQADWIALLDFDSLEPCKASYISDNLRERRSDMIWRIQFQGRWLYLYILVEFQSTVDHWMAVRLMTYMGLLYQDLIASEKLTQKDHLPPVFPMVFYTGVAPWHAPQRVSELLSPITPQALQAYFPDFRYELLDVGRYPLTSLQCEMSDNWVVPMIRLEQDAHEISDVFDHLAVLKERLKSPQYDSLRHAFMLYLKYSLDLPRRYPEIGIAHLDLKENQHMLRERLRANEARLMRQAKERGMQQGMQKIITNMLYQGAEDNFICKVSGYSKEELNALKSGEALSAKPNTS